MANTEPIQRESLDRAQAVLASMSTSAFSEYQFIRVLDPKDTVLFCATLLYDPTLVSECVQMQETKTIRFGVFVQLLETLANSGKLHSEYKIFARAEKCNQYEPFERPPPMPREKGNNSNNRKSEGGPIRSDRCIRLLYTITNTPVAAHTWVSWAYSWIGVGASTTAIHLVLEYDDGMVPFIPESESRIVRRKYTEMIASRLSSPGISEVVGDLLMVRFK